MQSAQHADLLCDMLHPERFGASREGRGLTGVRQAEKRKVQRRGEISSNLEAFDHGRKSGNLVGLMFGSSVMAGAE